MRTGPLNQMADRCLADSHRWFPDTPGRGHIFEVIHYTLGIAGETGEVVELIKKWQGGRPGYEMSEIRDRLAEEMCDVLMYIGDLAALLQLDLDMAFALKRAANDGRFL